MVTVLRPSPPYSSPMCERYALPDQGAAEREFLPATAWWQFAARYNVRPPQCVPAIRLHEQHSEAVMLRWGLIPSWFEGSPSGAPKSAVRSIRVENSKIYRGAWVKAQRCILPACGFYLWQLTAAKYRQPYFVRLTDRPAFGIAALWDRWVSEDDDVIESCALLSVPANELVSSIAGPAAGMPAILRRKDYLTWLHGKPAAAKAALATYNSSWMHAHPISPRINSAVDDRDLIRTA